MPSDKTTPKSEGISLDVRALISLTILTVCLAAVLAAWGLAPQRADTVGVDLGTTYSVVAYKHPISKKIIVIPTRPVSLPLSSSLQSSFSKSSQSSTSHLLTPSIVSYSNDKQSSSSNNNIVRAVGRDALPFLHTHSQNTIYNAKRLIGRTYKEVRLDKSLSSMPHQFGPVNETQGDNSLAGFIMSDATTTISPVDVASRVVGALVKAADLFLGHSNARKAVIAVPAQFNTAQREATALAFAKAGIKVINMLEEPTAAAVAYGLQNQPHIHNVLVYDFGGGTLDVSLLWMHTGSVQVIGTDGDSNLGGSDFDKCMVELLVEHLDQCEISKVRKIAEETKRILSYETSTVASCGDDIHLSSLQKTTVTRDLFEHKCKVLFDRSLIPIERLLVDQNILKTEIDEIVLVGGTTRIPKVKEMLTTFFNGKSPKDDIDPDLAVAYGCSMFSA